MSKLRGAYQVASYGTSILIRVSGSAHYQNSELFSEFVEASLEKGYAHFIVDLANCTGMDSTFMGVLVGIVSKANGANRVTVVNANASHRRLLDGLGIDAVIEIQEAPVSCSPDLKTETLSEDHYVPLKRMQLICKAHENLVRLNDKNKALFSEFLQQIQKELKEEN